MTSADVGGDVDRVFHEGVDCAAALVDDVLVLLWDGPAHLDVLRVILSAMQSLKRNELAHRKLYVLNVVTERASPPDSAGRAIAAKFPEHFDHHVQVAEGSGLRSSLIRSVLTGMALMSSVRARSEVTDTVAAGAARLVAAGAGAKRDRVERAVTVLRSRFKR